MVARKRVVLAVFLVTTCIALFGIWRQSGADTPSTRFPAVVRGSVYPSGFHVVSSAPEEVRLTLSVPALHLRPLGGHEYHLALEGGELLAVDRAPDLPVYRRLVAVADGGEVSVAVRVDGATVLNGVQVREYRRPTDRDSESSPPPFGQPAHASQISIFPATNARVEYVGHLRGQRIVSILVCPVQLDAVSRKATVATDMELLVTVGRAEGAVLNDVGPMDAALTGAVLNWSPRGSTAGFTAEAFTRRAIASTGGQVCWCTGSTWQDVATSAISCGADYLMIVTDSLASSSLIDSLALRRASYNGFNVAVARVSQLDSSPDTLDTPIAIRAMIDSVYSSQSAVHMSDGRLGYVLLLGDAFDSDRNVLVPSYYGYGSANNVLAASDAYYSFLDDPADLLPDVLIGRLPVDDDPEHWELTNVVSKIIAYEPLQASAWADSVLMVSGVNDDGFTFDNEGLSGFQAFFDSTLAYYSPPGKSVTQIHRLTLPASEGNHGTFGEIVASRVEAGKWLTAFFDHGFLYYWHGAFYPRNYEFLENEGTPTIVLSLGSYTSEFDNTQESAQLSHGGACCTVPPPSSIACESPGYADIDPCDVMAERLLVQPGGAIAVIGYSRTTQGRDAQADFVNLFRSLSQQNPGTLGEFLVGARLFRLSNDVTARNLMLLGDPALNIRTLAPAAADTFDVSIGTSDIRSPWGTYMRSNSTPIDIAIHNAWKTDVYDLEVELWRGEPEGESSTLLATEVIDTLRAHGPEITAFSVSGLEGNVRLYVRLDPDDIIAERAEDNNVAFRDFIAFRYEGDFPRRLPFTGSRRSATIADLASTAGKEFLVSGVTGSDNLLQCYAVGDTNAIWTHSTGSLPFFLKNSPVAGHMYKSAPSYVAVEWGNPSSVRILSGQSGAVVETRSVGDTRSLGNDWEAKCLLTDLGADDPAMELVMLRYIDGAIIDSLNVMGFAPNGPALFSRLVDAANIARPATMAVGDLDANGSKEIIILQALASGGSPASGNELSVFSYTAGALTRRWQRDVAGVSISAPALVLIDTDGDGDLSVLCNGASPGPVLRLYDADSALVWIKSDFTVGAPAYPGIYFSAGDIDGDGSAEVVVADHERVRVLASADASVLYGRTMAGDPVAPPLLADLDADGKLDVVVVFEQKDPNEDFVPNQYWTYLNTLDETLDLIQPSWTFRTSSSASNSCLPAIDDIDDDGKYEMVYVSGDQYLHVFELGSAAGDGAWTQRFGNALNTGLNEQPIVGSGYTQPVSLYQRTRMLGHVTLDSLAAPSLYVGHGTEVRVNASVADPYELRAFGSVRMKGSATEPVVLRSDPPASGAATWRGLYVDDRFAVANDPDTLSFVHLSDACVGVEGRSPLFIASASVSNVVEAGIVVADVLWCDDSVIENSADIGIQVLGGATLSLSNSAIRSCAQFGLLVYDESTLDAIGTSFDGNGIAAFLARESGSWVAGTISDCTFTNNAHGIWVDDTGDSSVVVEDCTIEAHATTGMYLEEANVVVDGTTMSGAEFGINAHLGTTLSLSNSAIEEASLYGLFAFNDSKVDVSETSFEGNDIGLSLAASGGSWIRGTIRDCSFTGNNDGIWIDDVGDSTVVIDDCVIDNSTTNGIYVEDAGSVTVKFTTITNGTIGVYTYGNHAHIGPGNTIQDNIAGITCDESSVAAVESCLVTDNTYAVTVRNGSNPDLGHVSGGNSSGYNIFTPTTTYYVNNRTSNTVSAEQNYWPASPPTLCLPLGSKIYGPVDADPALCSPPTLALFTFGPAPEAERPTRLPDRFALHQNVPNPFNPVTSIAYDVPGPGSLVNLSIYDVGGRRVAVLVDEYRSPGRHMATWTGRNRNGEPLASGVYFLRIRAGGFMDTKKLLLLK